MRYDVTRGRESFKVSVEEIDADTYEVCVDDTEPVRINAVKSPRTMYTLLLGSRQYEGSVDPREDGTLDVHVGASTFELTAIDERKALLSAFGGGAASGRQEIRAQMPGKIVKLLVASGDSVQADQGILILEAMKMENEIKSPIDGTVGQVEVQEGETVETDALMVVIEPPEED